MAPDHARFVPPPITVGAVTLDFAKPIIMGILNITPDSFSDGGDVGSPDEALQRARAMVEQGALIVDVGGESTRPGATPVSAEEEAARVLPVIEALARERLPAAISVDTAKARVAAAALAAGATIVNDVSALHDPEMAAIAAQHGAALIVMHMRGEPRTMQLGPIVYRDLLGEIIAALAAAVDKAVAAGVERSRILVDPGIGFGKTYAHNFSITKHIGALTTLGQPIVYAASRKRFLGEVTGQEPKARDRATAAACALAILGGAHVVRVHDVEAVRDAVLVAAAVRGAD